MTAATAAGGDVLDLLQATAALVAIPSVSHHEAALADHIEAQLRAAPTKLDVIRVGDNVVARTTGGCQQRLVLAGHLDTVPPSDNAEARIDGNRLWGVGAADMKGGLAIMLALAQSPPVIEGRRVDVTFVFYVCEEVARVHNGLSALFAARPELLAADAAILGEPTGKVVEAGCQGAMRVEVTVGGRRAHTARPWMGENAIHRLEPVLRWAGAYQGRRPRIEGCEYREALQAVKVEGGVAGNVVPDRATVTLNHRFAPDRSVEEAFTILRDALTEVGVGAGRDDDHVVLADAAPAAPPGLEHPLLRDLVARTGAPPRAKLGWTDVAFFAERGIPATNFGPGDPELAHTAGERVDQADLVAVTAALRSLITGVDG
jgi:succinyl-diaminopimelate desuccinylase